MLSSLSFTPHHSPQKFLNGEIHDWYRIVLGYSDHLVGQLLDDFGIQRGQKVLDPFCGTGTTMVECMKREIDAVGIDANPSSCFAAQVKTNWNLKSARLLELLWEIENRHTVYLRRKAIYRRDPTFVYLETSGMLERGWISPNPLRKAIAIKTCITELRTSKVYKNALLLALISEVVNSASNIKFGPEIYCGRAKMDVNVFLGFAQRVEKMAKDLDVVASLSHGMARVVEGDARECSQILRPSKVDTYAAAISSPPYPAEHDYTRNSRLELAFLEEITDRESLRVIKRKMIRSHTKCIYKGDNDAKLVENHPRIREIVVDVRQKIRHKDHGFARLYPMVIMEYFGGMKRHLASIKELLAPNAKCAYVLGDQSSYFQIHIPTAEILSSIAEEVGFETLEIRHWRNRWSTATSKELHENILVFQKRDL